MVEGVRVVERADATQCGLYSLQVVGKIGAGVGKVAS